MKRLIPFAIAIALIAIIALVWLIPELADRYEYSTEVADLEEYYEIYSPTEVPILLQDELIEDRAEVVDGRVYAAAATVAKLFTDRFYYNETEGLLQYTTAADVYTVTVGEESTSYRTSVAEVVLDYRAAYRDGETLMIALDYVKLYADFSYELFTEPYRMQVYNTWGTITVATIDRDTQVRTLGGVKSPILTEISEGDTVTVLEQMQTWTKVKTNNAIIGYVETKCLDDIHTIEQTPVTGAIDLNYRPITRENTIAMAWNYIASPIANDNLTGLTANAEGLNVVAPTWFYLNDNDGNFLSLASSDYIVTAHQLGLEVWAVIEDITYDVDLYQILSSSEKRAHLIQNLMTAADTYGFDGINIDFESVSKEEGPHFVQFLRELSIQTHQKGIVLSVDNYMPNAGNTYYNMKEQGMIADYVILMGYDEHWAGCGEAGSVASISFVRDGIQNTINKGVLAERIIAAIPFYTRIWETVGITVTDTTDSMINVEKWVNNRNIELIWDEETSQYYGEFQSGEVLYQVWLEEEKSIQAKLNVMLNFRLAGVGAWRLGYEKQSVWPLINSYVQVNQGK